MRYSLLAIVTLILLPPAVLAQKQGGYYTYIDENGEKVITDRPPPEASDLPKRILNDEGVTVGTMRGKKTAEELEQERAEAARQAAVEEQRKANQALLYTYQDVDEIELHRDRRLELFKAQVRVTELYLANQRRALDQMIRERGRYKPYSADPGAPPVPPDLVEAISDTEQVIRKQQGNLQQYKHDEQTIRERFDNDIRRFKKLKGIEDEAGRTMTASQP